MKQLLQDAIHEITTLRRQNEILTAQMAIVDVFAAALGLKRGYQAMTPDVVYQLQKKLDEITKTEE